jgi:ABC-2 type transport system ATP-binding protein
MTVLLVENATRSFGEVRALAGAGLEIAAGEVVGLLGPNGAGKSTLIRCLVTLERLDGGRITVGGADPAEDPAGVRALIGYAGQDAAVDKLLTGREFLRFQAGLAHLPRAEAGPRIEELLGRFRLLEAADRPTEGYSGGMRRRLDLAASLLHRPQLLVLDEPSAGLDYDARRDLWDLLGGLRRDDTAVLLATHDFEEADALCDRMVLLAAGVVAAAGTPDELRASLGSWVLEASLHEHPQDGDADRLAALAAGLPGRLLPTDGRRADFRFALAEESEGQRWVEAFAAAARAAGTDLFSVAVRRPTLQDVYLDATSAR